MTAAPRFRWVFLVIAATIVGGALRFGGLTRLELWFDENCTYYIAHHFFNWPATGPDRWLEVAHTPYFFLLSLWTSLAGESAWGLRSFSALIGTLTVLLVGLAGARLVSARVGVVAAILAAVHPLHIHYSQEARVYAFWALASLAMIYALMTAVRSGRRMWWVLFGLSAWLVVVTHYYALLLLPATVCATLAARDRERALKQWAFASAGLGLALLPVVVWLVIPHAQRGPKTWLAEAWRDGPGLIAVAKSVWAMMPAGGYPAYFGALAVWPETLRASAGTIISSIVAYGSLVVVAGVIGVCALASGRGPALEVIGGTERDRVCGGDCTRVTLALGMMTISFLLVAMVYSYVAGPAYVAGRYDFVIWPAVVIALAGAIDVATARLCGTSRSRSMAAAGIVVFLAGCSLATTLAAGRGELVQSSGAKADLITSRVGDDDLVVNVNQYRWFVAYEWSRRDFTASVVSYPSAHEEQICWRNPAAELADRGVLEADAESIVAKVMAKLSGDGRVWLLAHGTPETPEFQVDQILYAKLLASGVDIRPVDDWSGLAELLAEDAEE